MRICLQFPDHSNMRFAHSGGKILNLLTPECNKVRKSGEVDKLNKGKNHQIIILTVRMQHYI